MKETLDKFQHSIISGDSKHATLLLKTNSRISPKKQMDIYIEGYRIRLIEAVKTDYPATVNLLGKKSEKLIKAFVENTPSNSYSLDFYPFKFAAFLQDKKIHQSIKDLAILESAIAEIFLLPDSDPLKSETLMQLNEQQMAEFRFTARIASKLLNFSHDAENYLRDFRTEKNLKKINKTSTHLYIVRHNNEIKRHILTAEEYSIMKNLLDKKSIDQAIENAKINKNSEELIASNLSSWLQKWLLEGFFTQ